MGAWANRRLRTYSKGMRQRVGLAQALVNDPELVFLDEPTDGVDPGGRREIRDLMRTLRAEGRTVFVNSHLLGEIEQVADHVAILSKGRVLVAGPLEDLVRAGRHRCEVCTVGPVPPALRGRLEAAGHEVAGDRVVVEAADPGPVQPVIDALRGAGIEIRRVAELRQSLEDLFLAAVGDDTPGALKEGGAR
jgi:ABC-2 type transport system ATP-binding protein